MVLTTARISSRSAHRFSRRLGSNETLTPAATAASSSVNDAARTTGEMPSVIPVRCRWSMPPVEGDDIGGKQRVSVQRERRVLANLQYLGITGGARALNMSAVGPPALRTSGVIPN